MLFDNAWSLVRIVIVGTLAYASLIVLLRASGKRTLSKLNAFDFIVTVALGSTLATILLSDRVALAEGVVALALLVGLQFVASWLQARSSTIERLLTAEPTLLFYRGRWLDAALRQARVTRDEVQSAIRSSGLSGLEQVEAVVLEAAGELSVVRRGEGGSALLPSPKEG